jgi:intracellular sulfur oxidation DsrE/DsrF family protein
MHVIVLSNQGIGNAAPELNVLLLSNFLQTFITNNTPVHAICMYSNGVKLACEPSVITDQLQLLQATGTQIIVCKTCLQYFDITDKLFVGEIGTMPQIVQLQLEATKIFNL